MAPALEGQHGAFDERRSTCGTSSQVDKRDTHDVPRATNSFELATARDTDSSDVETVFGRESLEGEKNSRLEALDVNLSRPDVENRFNTRCVVFFLSTAILICYADRSNMSSAIIPMAIEFGWDEAQKGLILSSFFVGYAITQSAGGYWADRGDAKLILLIGVTSWSAVTFITPAICNRGTSALVIGRIGLGLGEGLAFPAAHAIISEHIPDESRNTAVAIVTAASYFGATLAFALTPTIIIRHGWRSVFHIFGSLAIVWAPLWTFYDLGRGQITCKPFSGSARRLHIRQRQRLATGLNNVTAESSQVTRRLQTQIAQRQRSADYTRTSVPSSNYSTELKTPREACPSSIVDPRELDKDCAADREEVSSFRDECSTETTRELLDEGLRKTLALLLSQKAVWAILVCQYCQSWGMYGLLSWLPTYMHQIHGVEMSEMGIYTTIPYVCQGVAAIFSGYLADFLMGKGFSTGRVRLLLQSISMIFPGGLLLLSILPHTTGIEALMLITIGGTLSALSCGAVSVNHLDIAPQHAGNRPIFPLYSLD